MDVYQFAMEMEKTGREYYLKLAEDTPAASGKRIFQILADEELRHYQYLQEMSKNSRVVVESDNVSAAENLFIAMLDSGEISGYKLPIDYYSQGVELEDKSITFYREKAMTETDPTARILFLKLYFEEKKHKLLLENILDMILEPERGLESPELVRPLKQEV